ncbi:MAG: phenylalanine--tRNA ligase subunit alpha [Candidatus Zixiibacteriota bacterium]|nr:MAG: phenylalanine--tRNA ligase subunit alpha [candidate division Zixibacteria bacterium]
MSVLDDISVLMEKAFERISQADSLAALNDVRVSFLGKKGKITAILKDLGKLPVEERRQIGAAANNARSAIERRIEEAKDHLGSGDSRTFIDPTLPGTAQPLGHVHILNQVTDDICRTFYGMGFEIAHGPDIETDYYNFEALNFPPDHPARDMQDTLFVEGERVLRTHTTPVQVRELERRKPPIKIITPGRCFRNEAISTRAHVAFTQVDGFLVDEGISVSDLKGVLVAFCKAFFGEDVKLNFRPSFFPFTEPSAEVDVSCILCGGKGCQLCKYSGWLEILGCGMIDPNVLDTVGIDSEKYTGYAFGLGVERIAMLKYKINDIRLFFNNDVRFLSQFK